ncbi:heme-dependent oxidative N-demethylase family protein [Aspergillus undulatus]|uniref:heme-dependent oxidative N-demethylase family protein n=1 Tax=Aspergillus undulatus TaxID=1810928 RepID=UPI003CCDAB68
MKTLASVGLAILLLTFVALKLRKDPPSCLKVTKHIAQRAGCNDIKRMAPYPAQPIKGRDRYRVMMDVRKLDVENWLTLDKNYMDEHVVRSQLLAHEKQKVFQCLPESYDACLEALEEVVEFLTQRFANMFGMKKDGEKTTVYNKVTDEAFAFGGDRAEQMDPLEIAVRLTMEDLSILMKNADGEYYLAASASLFPVGWTVAERIGWTISQLHNPVPLWHQQVANSVSKFLCRLTPESPMERSNYFVEVKRPDEDLFDILYRPTTLSEDNPDPSPQDLVIRRERQTFRRLPRTGTIVFGVKTFLTTLDELPMQELENLAREMKSWPEHVGEYKGREIWGAKALEFFEQRREEQKKDQMDKKMDV